MQQEHGLHLAVNIGLMQESPRPTNIFLAKTTVLARQTMHVAKYAFWIPRPFEHVLLLYPKIPSRSIRHIVECTNKQKMWRFVMLLLVALSVSPLGTLPWPPMMPRIARFPRIRAYICNQNVILDNTVFMYAAGRCQFIPCWDEQDVVKRVIDGVCYSCPLSCTAINVTPSGCTCEGCSSSCAIVGL